MMNLRSRKSKTIIAIVAVLLCIAMIIPFMVSMFV